MRPSEIGRANTPLGGKDEAQTALTTFLTPPPLGQEQVLACGSALGLVSPESKQRETACLWSTLLLVSVETQRRLPEQNSSLFSLYPELAKQSDEVVSWALEVRRDQ